MSEPVDRATAGIGPDANPGSNPDTKTRRRSSWAGSMVRFLILYLFVIALLSTLGWCVWVYVQIERYAYADQAAPSDVICVLGAAEYAGRPSPVLRARLDHALALYEHGIAPVMVTMGGGAPGDSYTEGKVGQAYLMANGVPEKAIIAETTSRTTEEQARSIVAIAHTNGYHRVVVVSDPAHLFRIRELCASDGLMVLTSPRPQVAAVGSASEWQQVWHEIVAYTAWRAHLS